MFKKRGKYKKAQVWVETVIYTLIALVMIGTVVSIVKPKIEESQDKAIIDQSMALMKDIDSILIDIKQAPGNQRIIELGIKKGSLLIDGEYDRIIFEVESRYEYSEPGEDIEDGASGIIVHTQQKGKFNNVTLTKYYSEDYNLSYSGKDELKSITAASTPYSMTLLNRGRYQFTDISSSCDSDSNLTLVCINPEYQIDYSKSCSNLDCRYTYNKREINIEVN